MRGSPWIRERLQVALAGIGVLLQALRVPRLVFVLGMAVLSIAAQAQTFAYVADLGSNNVSVIDTASNIVVATVGVGNLPVAVAITPDGTRAYVTNKFSNTVSVIDTASNTLVATVVGLGSGPSGVAITPDGTRAYVANYFSNTVSVIDTVSNTVVATVGVGGVGTFPSVRRFRLPGES